MSRWPSTARWAGEVAAAMGGVARATVGCAHRTRAQGKWSQRQSAADEAGNCGAGPAEQADEARCRGRCVDGEPQTACRKRGAAIDISAARAAVHTLRGAP